MKKEGWIDITPKNMPKTEFAIQELIQDYDGNMIKMISLLGSPKYKFTVFFEGFIYGIQSYDLGLRSKTTNRVMAEYGNDFFKGSYLFQIKHSHQVDYFNEDSGNYYLGPLRCEHYVLVTGEDYVDIFSDRPPEVKFWVTDDIEGNDHLEDFLKDD